MTIEQLPVIVVLVAALGKIAYDLVAAHNDGDRVDLEDARRRDEFISTLSTIWNEQLESLRAEIARLEQSRDRDQASIRQLTRRVQSLEQTISQAGLEVPADQ